MRTLPLVETGEYPAEWYFKPLLMPWAVAVSIDDSAQANMILYVEKTTGAGASRSALFLKEKLASVYRELYQLYATATYSYQMLENHCSCLKWPKSAV